MTFDKALRSCAELAVGAELTLRDESCGTSFKRKRSLGESTPVLFDITERFVGLVISKRALGFAEQSRLLDESLRGAIDS